MSLERDITAIKILVETNDDYMDHPDPSGLVRAAHFPRNVRLVWWYNPHTAEFVKSKDPNHMHALDIGTKVKDYRNWVRGRVFSYENHNYLIIYFLGDKNIGKQQISDIFDKAYHSSGVPITRVIDDTGNSIDHLLEASSYTIETSKLGGWKINEAGNVIETEPIVL